MSHKEQDGWYYRDLELSVVPVVGEDKKEIPNRFRCTASTNAAIRCRTDEGEFFEQLEHSDEAIELLASTVLFNHNKDFPIGGIINTHCDGMHLEADLDIDPAATASSGINLLRSIKDKHIRGISIGYKYLPKNCVITRSDDGIPLVRVKKWQLREISVTPIPADPDASIRSRMEFSRPGVGQQEVKAMAVAEPVATGASQSGTDEVRALRSQLEVATRTLELNKVADGHNFRGLDFTKVSSKEEGLSLILAEVAKRNAPPDPKFSTVVVERDATDKLDEAATDGLIALFQRGSGKAIDPNSKDLGMRFSSVLDIGRAWAEAQGMRCNDRRQLASYLIGTGKYRSSRMGGALRTRDAGPANATTGMFATYLLANVMDKVIMKGFEDYSTTVTYPLWTSSRQVTDFKQFTGAALDLGNLAQVAEDIAFPELTKSEGGYIGKLGMWGGTVSLSLQALINDDMGEFVRALGRTGAVAQRTIDIQVYAAMEAATWTNRTQTGDLADGTIDTARAAMANTLGPAQVKLGYNPRWLIVPSVLRSQALKSCYGTFQGLEAKPLTILPHLDMHPIVTPFLTAAATGTQSTWYVAGDQQVVDAVIVAKLAGQDNPMVEEFDSGAVAARKWKVMLPFAVVIPSALYGLYRSTHQ